MSEESKPTVILTMAEKRKEIPEYVQGMKCPKCGSIALDGFGLAGGGFGVYKYCEKCAVVVSKSIVED